MKLSFLNSGQNKCKIRRIKHDEVSQLVRGSFSSSFHGKQNNPGLMCLVAINSQMDIHLSPACV